MEVEYPCPLCGADTNWKADCPGYERDGLMKVCHPPCCNALRFVCTQCDWWYRSPNRRKTADMGTAPSWLDKALAEFAEV